VAAERKVKRTTQSSFVFHEDYLHHKQRLKVIVVCHSTGSVTSHRHSRNEEGTFLNIQSKLEREYIICLPVNIPFRGLKLPDVQIGKRNLNAFEAGSSGQTSYIEAYMY